MKAEVLEMKLGCNVLCFNPAIEEKPALADEHDGAKQEAKCNQGSDGHPGIEHIMGQAINHRRCPDK